MGNLPFQVEYRPEQLYRPVLTLGAHQSIAQELLCHGDSTRLLQGGTKYLNWREKAL